MYYKFWVCISKWGGDSLVHLYYNNMWEGHRKGSLCRTMCILFQGLNEVGPSSENMYMVTSKGCILHPISILSFWYLLEKTSLIFKMIPKLRRSTIPKRWYGHLQVLRCFVFYCFIQTLPTIIYILYLPTNASFWYDCTHLSARHQLVLATLICSRRWDAITWRNTPDWPKIYQNTD